MRIKLHHTKYIARRVARDLVNCDFVEVRKTKDEITQEIQRILTEDIEKEHDLDEKVAEILEAQEAEIEFLNADYRQLFWMTKKRMANEFGVILNNEDRFSDIAHKMLDYLWEEDYIHYTCSDNQVKNVIFTSIDEFLKGFEESDSAVLEKIKHYKRKLIPGTEEYDIVYNRLYEEELIKRGLM
ncbi:DUF507 family protein [Malaciobacter mytili]|uniref:Competence protein n=1 Tax=Malaciobacter mytili LMG 24559 TaxID=1032238 RepID=A0AAX2ABJ9_9BACT|nr:DUF507 family protein [Malaciobacter mytili]AXH13780.1 DUF507 domain-containing protein [Malaciobacter mytili LMG 24559]RXI42151.1 competence protein [Malaciobacter mytili]RXK12923.1 competence protein [Malaciobacter mytili LMG 24559]